MAGSEVTAERLREQTDAVVAQLKRVIVGQDEAMRQVLTAFFAGGTTFPVASRPNGGIASPS